MSVHLTRIYTKTGDDGTTALGDMSRVAKTDPRITAYADVDEANSAIGMAIALGAPDADVATILTIIHNDLFDVGADLCTPLAENPTFAPLRVTDTQVTALENWCDQYNESLPKLNSFTLPGGSPAAALLHNARAITRRAERSVWALLAADAERTHRVPATYLNRLSDLLFILARHENHRSGAGDVLWKPGGDR